ncbi:MAG: hypothetical protein V3T83_18045 [Acidobacteriota bacterium]
MARLNLTLTQETFDDLSRHAEQSGVPRARLAREILAEGLEERTSAEKRLRLAQDYRAGRRDAQMLLQDLEVAQLELLGEEDQ